MGEEGTGREGKGMGKGKGEGEGEWNGMGDEGRGCGKEGGWGKEWRMRDVGRGMGIGKGCLGTGPGLETQVNGRVSRMGGFRVEGLSLYFNGCEQ